MDMNGVVALAQRIGNLLFGPSARQREQGAVFGRRDRLVRHVQPHGARCGLGTFEAAELFSAIRWQAGIIMSYAGGARLAASGVP